MYFVPAPESVQWPVLITRCRWRRPARAGNAKLRRPLTGWTLDTVKRPGERASAIRQRWVTDPRTIKIVHEMVLLLLLLHCICIFITVQALYVYTARDSDDARCSLWIMQTTKTGRFVTVVCTVSCSTTACVWYADIGNSQWCFYSPRNQGTARHERVILQRRVKLYTYLKYWPRQQQAIFVLFRKKRVNICYCY